MSKVAVVKLNESEHVVKFVGGREVGDDGNGEKYRQGVAMFIDDKYILNFVTLKNAVDLLSSDMDLKVINDVGFIMISDYYALRVLKHYNHTTVGESSMFFERIPNDIVGQHTFYRSTSIYNELHFTSDNEGAFSKALKCAMVNPFTETNLYISIPEGAEEEVF